MSIATFTLRSATTQAAAPFAIGHGFRKGAVPSGSYVVSDLAYFQCVPKNTWPDGSLKFALLHGRAPLTADTALTVTLSIGGDAGGVDLTTSDLKATGITAAIVAGAFGSATWATTDWDAPFQTWVSGPAMSSWVYRKQIGSDAHLVGWLEVRLWAGGEVEVLPWIENGYIRVVAPINKSETYTFTLGGGTQRVSVAIDLKHHQRTPLINGPELSYWLGADPAVVPSHDKAYLQSTELVPTYSATVAPTAAIAVALVGTYAPLQAGNIIYGSDSMASSGYQSPIGMLPQCDVLYLVSDAANAYGAVVRNGFSAGRYSIHYRDETTNRPPLFSSYPNLNIGSSQGFKDTGGSTINDRTPTATGGSGPQWDVAHSPALGYLAYLVTGRWYFMEEVQFITTANYLGNGDAAALREGSKGIVKTAYDAWQTRSCAWDWRARVMALTATPDDDTSLRNEFIASVQYNIDHFWPTYVNQANNTFGWIRPGETYSGKTGTGAPWQQDFVTAAFGFSVSLDLPISSTHKTKLSEFFQWKARSVVMRLGGAGEFWYINADMYNQSISPNTVPDYLTGTGPWHATDLDSYNASVSIGATPTWLGGTEGNLAGEAMPGEKSLWGNLMPAIAYAVRHNVPGAETAYRRLTSATNFPALATAFNNVPVWSVQPPLNSYFVATPGPSGVMDSVSLLGADSGVMDTHRGHGVPLTEVPIGGEHGTCTLRDMIEAGDDPLSEIRWRVTRWPTLGVLTLDGVGGWNYDGEPDSFDAIASVDGADYPEITITLAALSSVSGVTITPSSGVVEASGTRTHSASVTGVGSPSQEVTWSTTLGTINPTTGLLAAPAATLAAQNGTITARSTQDSTKTGTATFTVPAGVSAVSDVTITPADPTIAGGASQLFTAVVGGTFSPSQAVTWASTIGTINPLNGDFTAPAAGASPQTGTVTATSTQDDTVSGTVTITVPSVESAVTGVTVDQANLVVGGGDSITYTATVDGTGNPSPIVTWAATIGTIDQFTGAFTAPDATLLEQTGLITARSVQDPNRTGTTLVTVAAGSPQTIAAPRYARPASDVSQGAWSASSGSDLYAMVDEVTSSGSDYIVATTTTTCRMKLGPVLDPHTSANQAVRYQAWAPGGGSLTVRLLQGDIVIATRTHASLPDVETIDKLSLSAAECDAITDYTDLYIELVAG